MSNKTVTKKVEIQVIPFHEWEKHLAPMMEKSKRMEETMRQSGEEFYLRILAPKVIRGRKGEEVGVQDQITLASVKAEFDDFVSIRDMMVDHAREIITLSLAIGINDPALPIALSALIEGKGLFEYNIGEFFLLYGRFEGSVKSENLISEMEKLVGDDESLKRPVRDRDGVKSRPLPYVVRQTLAHFGGGNPDWKSVSREDVQQSIDLLKQWLKEN